MEYRPRQNPYEELEKELVAEQPGLALGMFGLCLALFLGLGLRFISQSNRYLELVEKAGQQIDPRVQTHVGSVRISLSDGFLPELAVVVKDVSFESGENCWLRPVMEVDEIKLPIDFFKLFRGQIFVHEILAGEVSLSLRSDLSLCHGSERTPQAEPQTTGAMASPSNFSALQSLKQTGNSIDRIEVQRLRVHYLPVLFTSLEVRRFVLDVENQSPREMSASGFISLAGETLSGDYTSTANFKVNFSERNGSLVKFGLDGNWREGHYQVEGQFKPNTQDVKVDFDMNEIPLNQLLPLLRKYKVITAELSGKQNWLSLSGHLQGVKTAKSWPPLTFEKIKIEGAVGEIEAHDVVYNQELSPFDVDIRSLQIEPLLNFLSEPRRHPMFGKLGTFHGKLHFADRDNIKMKGELTGLEFIFSNRGLRQGQILSLVSMEAIMNRQKVTLHLDQVKPSEGLFLGDVTVNSDLGFNSILAKLRVDDLSLAPAVQKLITSGGGLGSISGEVSAGFEKGSCTDLRGHVSVSDIEVEKLSLKKAKASFTTDLESGLGVVSMNIKGQGINVTQGSEPFKFLSLILGSKTKENFEFLNASVNLKTQLLKDLKWDLGLQGPSENIKSVGGWDTAGGLSGQITVQEAGQKSVFRISGVRDLPVVSKQ